MHAIPEHSVLVLTGAMFGPDMAGHVLAEIEAAVGHDRFCLLLLAEGASEVWGPDTDLVAKLRALLPVVPAHDQPPAVTDPGEAHPAPVTTSSDELRARAGAVPRAR